MILTQAQADAVYRAMVSLNNVSGIVDIRIPCGNGRYAVVKEEIMSDDIIVQLHWGGAMRDSERYYNQVAFAQAYGVE
jgi:hypothetical protein